MKKINFLIKWFIILRTTQKLDHSKNGLRSRAEILNYLGFRIVSVFLFLAMFSSTTYSTMFKELLNDVHVDGVLTRDWCEVPIQKWHVLQDTVINSTEEEAKYSRAYVTELASQFREEEFITRIQLKGSGIQFQVGFSTDVSESCVWVTPFIKPSDDMSDVR